MKNDHSLAREYANKNILITGGMGFIGSNLAIALVKMGAHVTIIDACIPDTGCNVFNLAPIRHQVEVVRANIHSKKILPYLSRAEIVFNLAGVLSHIDALRDPIHDLQINAVDQLRFLLLCMESNPGIRIVYTGTRNQYGKAKTVPVSEDHPFEPIDTNGISEIASEHYHMLYWKLYGLRSSSIRLCNVFGPRHQMRHSRQGVLNWFLRQILEGKKISLMGGGNQIRDCVYVEDVVRALLLLGVNGKSWGQAFNIGAFPISLQSFVKPAITIAGKGEYESVPFPEDRLRIEPGDYIADSTKLSTLTGWSPEWSLDRAIEDTIHFYQQNQKHYWR